MSASTAVCAARRLTSPSDSEWRRSTFSGMRMSLNCQMARSSLVAVTTTNSNAGHGSLLQDVDVIRRSVEKTRSQNFAQTAPASAAPRGLVRAKLVPESATTHRPPSQSTTRADWPCTTTVVDEKTSCALLPGNGCPVRRGGMHQRRSS